MSYAMSEEHFERMSQSEQEFLTKFINATERLMHDSVLKGLPEQYQSLVSQMGDDQTGGASEQFFDMGTLNSTPSHSEFASFPSLPLPFPWISRKTLLYVPVQCLRRI